MTVQERRRDEIIKILKDVEFPVIVEAGACHAEDSQMLTYAANRRENLIHILIEPDPENCEVIRNNGLNVKGRRLIEGAIGNTSSIRGFNRAIEIETGYRFCGSLLKPREDAFSQMSFDETVEVRCYTLDEIFEQQNLSHIDLLWVDIQGAEREMILGGQLALSKTRYLFIEVVDEPEYAGQATGSELLSLLNDWSIIGDFEGDMLLRNEKYQESV